MQTLPKSLRRRPFTYDEARRAGLTQYAIQKLLHADAIERVERGLYRATGEDLSEEDLYRGATKRVGKRAAVCLLSALSHYELTDAIPRKVWLMVDETTRTKSENLKLYRARNPRWKIGILTRDGYEITSLERTIVECLTVRASLSPRLGIDALRRAVVQGKTTGSKVLQASIALGVKHKVLPYIEAIS